MFELIQKIFGKECTASKDVAKERLRLVLVHDRVDTSPQLVEELKNDMLKVLSKHMDFNEKNVEIHFAHTQDSVALIANIPINKMKRTNL